MDNIGHMLICDQCKWRPLYGSPLEKWFALLILSLIDMLTPFKLVTREAFERYYKHFCVDWQSIYFRRGDGDMYKTSVWQMHAVTFQILLTRLLGKTRNTRYVHAISSCGMFWIDVAEKLLTTVRSIFGLDGMEILNDKVKASMRMNSNKFGTTMKDLLTLIRLMRWHLWDHIEFREGNPRINTQRAQRESLKRQWARDKKTMEHSDSIRDFFARVGLVYLPDKQYRLGKQQTRDMINELQMVGLNRLLDFTDLQSDTDSDDDEAKQELVDDDFDAVPDPETMVNDYLNADRDVEQNAPDSDSDDGGDVSNAVTFDSDHYPGMYIRAIYARVDNGGTAWDAVDACGNWKLLGPVSVERRNSRLFLGVRDITIQGHFRNAQNNVVEQQLKWSYKQLFGLALSDEDEDRCSVYFKFTTMAKSYTRDSSAENTQWTACTNLPSKCAQYLAGVGAVRVDFRNTVVGETALRASYSNHPTIKKTQKISLSAYSDLSASYNEDEEKRAEARFRTAQYPVYGNHRALDKEINDHFAEAEHGRRSKKCANCQKQVFTYQTHAICIRPEDDVDSVSNVILGRLGCERPLGTLDYPIPAPEAALKVVYGDDPAARDVCIARDTLAKCPLLWVPFMLNTFCRAVSLNMKYRPWFIEGCKTDQDWRQLALRPSQLMTQMNHAMKETLNTLPQGIMYQSREEFIYDMFAAISGIFKIDVRYCHVSIHGAAEVREHQRKQVLWNTHLDHTHIEYADDDHFALWGQKTCGVMLNNWVEPRQYGTGWIFWVHPRLHRE